jgi:hypothetical protein
MSATLTSHQGILAQPLKVASKHETPSPLVSVESSIEDAFDKTKKSPIKPPFLKSGTIKKVAATTACTALAGIISFLFVDLFKVKEYYRLEYLKLYTEKSAKPKSENSLFTIAHEMGGQHRSFFLTKLPW